MNCPTCGKPVDPLRAPAVSVRDGKVVGFCSRECKSAAESQPAKLVPTKTVRVPAGTEPNARPRTPAGGVVIPTAPSDLDSGPVIEILHEPASGVVTSAADARSSKVAASSSRAETDGAIQIADTGHLDDYVAFDEPRRGRGLVILIVLFVLGGAVGGAYYLGYFDKMLGRNKTAVTTPPPAPIAPPVAAPPDAQVLIEPVVAVERAQAVLREQMKSESLRVQRVAAMAMSRTGDAAAIQMLAAALEEQRADLNVAYVLARAGDKRGFQALEAAVATNQRDTRLDAGRRFALLGDKRAIRALESYLEVSQLRLGVAEQLAYLAEPRALKVLDGVRADDKAVPDERARATIALGNAGRADVAPALHELLTDDRQNSFAAQALAGLHDEAARPVLVDQLRIPSLRVKSARALRRLDPAHDVRALFPPLLAALDSYKDTEQVQVAEAILLLAGPPAWSERE